MLEPRLQNIAAPAPFLPTLALQQLVATRGVYPSKDGAGMATNYLGMIQTFAGGMDAYGAPPAQGQLLPLGQNTALYSLYADSYGGDGKTCFALPDLTGRAAVAGQPGETGEQSLAMTWIISATAPVTGAEPPLGSVALFGGNFAPPGWLPCDGRLLPTADFPELGALIGTIFGGDDSAFALPDLSGRAAVGVGQGPGLSAVALGEVVEGSVTGVGLNYIIATDGQYPSANGGGEFPTDTPFLGQVTAYAGAAAPAGWATCDGTLLKVADHQALYSLLGPAYGGDGITAFALPDLRGRMAVGR